MFHSVTDKKWFCVAMPILWALGWKEKACNKMHTIVLSYIFSRNPVLNTFPSSPPPHPTPPPHTHTPYPHTHKFTHSTHSYPLHTIKHTRRVNHSKNAIVKPQGPTAQEQKREVEEAMKRVREVQQAIANAIEPSDKGI